LLTTIVESTYLNKDIRASLNNRKMMKAEHSRLIP